VVLRARETWPRTTKVYCHPSETWPDDAEVLERVPVRVCARRGAAIDLVLDRARENRSQFVFTMIKGGRQVIFWQTSRTSRQARPMVRIPTSPAVGVELLQIVIDDRERYPYRFDRKQVVVTRQRMPAGDYGVELEGRLVAAVERKSLADLVGSLTGGRLGFPLAELAALPRSAVVVEERYSKLLQYPHVRAATVATALAEAQVRWPSVPIVFCETRPLAEEWTYRYLAAALVELADQAEGPVLPAVAAPSPAPTAAQVRRWAKEQGLDVPARGRLHPEVMARYRESAGLDL
jgi:hypothetical protein